MENTSITLAECNKYQNVPNCFKEIETKKGNIWKKMRGKECDCEIPVCSKCSISDFFTTILGKNKCRNCDINDSFLDQFENKIDECIICLENKEVFNFCKNGHYWCRQCSEYKMNLIGYEPQFPFNEDIENKYWKWINNGYFLTDQNLIDKDENFENNLTISRIECYNEDTNEYEIKSIKSELPNYFGNIINNNNEIDVWENPTIQEYKKKIEDYYAQDTSPINSDKCSYCRKILYISL